MKVNSVLWLWIVSAVLLLCLFECGSSASTSSKRPATSTKSSNGTKVSTTTRTTTSTTAIKRKSGTGTSSSTTKRQPSAPQGPVEGSTPKSIRQLDIPANKNRKKNTNPKKYSPEQRIPPIETTSTGPIKVSLNKPRFQTEKRASKNPRDTMICPRESEVKFDLFPIKCERDKDCKSWTTNQICCEIFGAKSCVAGLPKPLEETSHSPIFGFIPRHCPQRPLAELWWEVKVCETDRDCWPRVCCPDGRKRYCRTSQPELEIVPVPVKRSLNYLSEYLECTPAPPPVFDLHPKECNSTFDCFPNVCCQEAGKKHCRPPKKSVLTLMANFLNLGLVKRLTKNIVIK